MKASEILYKVQINKTYRTPSSKGLIGNSIGIRPLLAEKLGVSPDSLTPLKGGVAIDYPSAIFGIHQSFQTNLRHTVGAYYEGVWDKDEEKLLRSYGFTGRKNVDSLDSDPLTRAALFLHTTPKKFSLFVQWHLQEQGKISFLLGEVSDRSDGTPRIYFNLEKSDGRLIHNRPFELYLHELTLLDDKYEVRKLFSL